MEKYIILTYIREVQGIRAYNDIRDSMPDCELQVALGCKPSSEHISVKKKNPHNRR